VVKAIKSDPIDGSEILRTSHGGQLVPLFFCECIRYQMSTVLLEFKNDLGMTSK